MGALVGYVPVLHAGYLKLFEKFSGSDLHILGEEFLAEEPRLERDMRALSPQTIAEFARTLNTLSYAGVLTKETLDKLSRYPRIILPDEDISRRFAENYLKGMRCEIVFESVFLRWDRMASTMNRVVDGVTERRLTKHEESMMQRAIEAADLSSDWWRHVGAVVFKDGKYVASSWNKHYPSEHSPYIVGDPRSNFNAGEYIDHSTALHAEASVVAQVARSSWSLSGADVFVTTFPCPPCAALLARCGIRRLYFLEGYSLVGAKEELERAGIEIIRVIQ